MAGNSTAKSLEISFSNIKKMSIALLMNFFLTILSDLSVLSKEVKITSRNNVPDC